MRKPNKRELDILIRTTPSAQELKLQLLIFALDVMIDIRDTLSDIAAVLERQRIGAPKR